MILKAIIDKPNAIGVPCQLAPGFLQVEEIDLLKLNPNIPEKPATAAEIIDCGQLFKILKLATVKRLGVTVQSNRALEELINILSRFGSLKELTIANINSRQLFGQLGRVFTKHLSLEKIKLGSIPEVNISERERQMNAGGYTSRAMVLTFPQVEWLGSLPLLNSLELRTISVSEEVREQIIRLTNILPYLRKENIKF